MSSLPLSVGLSDGSDGLANSVAEFAALVPKEFPSGRNAIIGTPMAVKNAAGSNKFRGSMDGPNQKLEVDDLPLDKESWTVERVACHRLFSAK